MSKRLRRAAPTAGTDQRRHAGGLGRQRIWPDHRPEWINPYHCRSGGFLNAQALKSDGSVLGWGYAIYVGTTTNAIAISTAYAHTLALHGDGTLTAWGGNSHGESTIPAA